MIWLFLSVVLILLVISASFRKVAGWLSLAVACAFVIGLMTIKG